MRKKLVIGLLAVALSAFGADATAGGSTVAQQGSFTGASDSFFGYSVAVDGNTAVVGAWNDAGGNGAAYVFTRNGSGAWSQQQELTAPDGASGDQFGYAVAVSGNIALVGAAGKASGQGYVYAFSQSGTTWTKQAEFTSSDGSASDCFGCAIALSGGTAFVGAPGKLGNTGGAYAFGESGGAWSQGTEFVGQSSSAYFGFSVALAPNATTAVVGAFGTSSSTGSAYVFDASGSTWSQQAVLTASDGATGDNFGYSVGAGNGTALVGAYGNGGQGAAYYFTGSGTSWSQQAKLVASDASANAYFGYAVALSGSTAVVGAYEKSTSGGPGEAYVFTNSGSAWSQQSLPPQGAYFGYAVAASGTTAVVGALAGYSGEVAMYAPAATPPAAAAPALGGKVALLAMALLAAACATLRAGSRREGAAL